MPKFPVKPAIRLTKKQWKAFLARIFEKEGKMPAKYARGIMGRYEPPVEREMGTLFRDIPTGVGESRRIAERLPIGEARARYFSSPEQYVTPSMTEPTAKQMTISKPGMAGDVAYERLRFRPVIPPSIQRAAGTLRREAQAGETTERLRGIGVRPEELRPGMEPGAALTERGLAPTKGPPVSAVVQDAARAAILWKELGGPRSSAGKYWQTLADAQPGAVRKILPTGQDWFTSCYTKWRREPIGFKRKHPREAGLFEGMKKDPDLNALMESIEELM